MYQVTSCTFLIRHIEFCLSSPTIIKESYAAESPSLKIYPYVFIFTNKLKEMLGQKYLKLCGVKKVSEVVFHNWQQLAV